MKNIVLLFTFFYLLLIHTNGFSIEPEKGVIKGKITDESGSGLNGATIVIKGTYLGVNSGTEGNYEFSGLKNGIYTLQYSFIGYKTRIMEVNLLDLGIVDVSLQPEAYLAPEVVVMSTRAGNRTPVAQTNVNLATIDNLNTGVDLPYLLSQTPSLVETSEAGNGVGYTNMRLRGSDASRINVTIDGIPLNDPESQQVFWVDLPDLASSVDNIQVQRGVGTSSNGSGAFGGSINIQTENPENTPFSEISESYGSFNTFKSTATLGTGLLDNKVSFLLRLSDLRSDGYIDRAFSRDNSMFISSVYNGARSRLRANIIIGKERTGISWNGVTKELLETNRRYNSSGEYTDENGVTQYYKDETDNYTQNHLQLFYSLSLNSNLTFNTAFHYTYGAGFYEEYKEDKPLASYGLPVINIGDSVIYTSVFVSRKWMKNDFYGLIYSLNFRKDKIEAIIGGGINRYNGDHFGKVIWMRNASNTEPGYQWYLNNATKDEFNIYSKITYSVTNRINLFGDLQYRYIGYKLAGPDDDVVLDQNHKFNFFNPKAGLYFNITPNQDSYISFSVANREPTRANYKDAEGDNKATPRAETLYDFESGYNLRSEKITLSANLYYMLYHDQLVPTGELSNVGYPIMTNVGKSYRTGIEMMVGARPRDFLTWNLNFTLSRNRIMDFVEYYTDYNTSDWSSEYKSKLPAEVEIAYSPSFTGSSDIGFLPFEKAEIHLISKYVGKQYFDNTQSQTRQLNGYFVNNLRFDYTVKLKKIKNAGFRFLINNIFNNEYENNAYGGNWYEDGVEKTWAYYFPQAFRNYMFSVNLKF